jgi:hypothetical protein
MQEAAAARRNALMKVHATPVAVGISSDATP